jgi:hypothetical protein
MMPVGKDDRVRVGQDDAERLIVDTLWQCCPQCGAWVSSQMITCPTCGHDLFKPPCGCI